MKKHFFSRILVLLIALLLPFTALSNASADPTRQLHFTTPVIFDGPVSNPCGFDIAEHDEGLLRWIGFFADDGSQTGLHLVYGQAQVTWSANGKTLKVNVAGPAHYTFLEDKFIMVSVGTYAYIVIPGYGPAGGIAGRLYFIPMEDHWELINTVGNDHSIPDWGPICDYFSE